MPASLMNTCLARSEDGISDRDLLECVSDEMTKSNRAVFLMVSAAMVFVMQAGFAMLCAGAVRKKNVQNTMLKNLLDACGASAAFWSVGYAFAFGGMDETSSRKNFVGNQNFFLMGVDDLAFWIFQFAFSAASATIVAGTLAERCQMAAYLCYSLMLTGWVYPIVAHAIWNPNGFLNALNDDPLWGVGMIDFAGSGVVHMTGGVTALFATLILGPRRGRFHDETGRKLETPREFPGHSVALQMLGTFILWFGWYGFNGGSALLGTNAKAYLVAARAATNTTLSGGFGGIVALFCHLWYMERQTGEIYFDLKYAMNGSLSGLVAITAGCGIVEPWAAVLIGAVSGIVYLVSSEFLIHVRVDDAVDAIPVHLFNGMWGVLSVGLFASPTLLEESYNHGDHPGIFYSWHQGHSDAVLLGTQIVGMLFILGWVMVIMLPFFIWLDWKGWFRSDPLEEIVGLDRSYHGGLALLTATGGHVDGVNPEYISAYTKQKTDSIRNRRPNLTSPMNGRTPTTVSTEGGREEPESRYAAALPPTTTTTTRPFLEDTTDFDGNHITGANAAHRDIHVMQREPSFDDGVPSMDQLPNREDDSMISIDRVPESPYPDDTEGDSAMATTKEGNSVADPFGGRISL